MAGPYVEVETEQIIFDFAIILDRPDMAHKLLEKFRVSQGELQRAFLSSIRADRRQVFEALVSYGVNINIASYQTCHLTEGGCISVIPTPIHQALSSINCDVAFMVGRLVEMGVNLGRRHTSGDGNEYSDMEIGALICPTIFKDICPEERAAHLALVSHRGPQEFVDFISTANIPIVEQEQLIQLTITVYLEYSKARGLQVRPLRNLLEAITRYRTSPYVIEKWLADMCRHFQHHLEHDLSTDLTWLCTDLVPIIMDFSSDLA